MATLFSVFSVTLGLEFPSMKSMRSEIASLLSRKNYAAEILDWAIIHRNLKKCSNLIAFLWHSLSISAIMARSITFENDYFSSLIAGTVSLSSGLQSLYTRIILEMALAATTEAYFLDDIEVQVNNILKKCWQSSLRRNWLMNSASRDHSPFSSS